MSEQQWFILMSLILVLGVFIVRWMIDLDRTDLAIAFLVVGKSQAIAFITA